MEYGISNNFAQEAQDVVRRNPEGVYYYMKFGSPLEKAIAEVFIEASGDIDDGNIVKTR